jgi:hypothetical protein
MCGLLVQRDKNGISWFFGVSDEDLKTFREDWEMRLEGMTSEERALTGFSYFRDAEALVEILCRAIDHDVREIAEEARVAVAVSRLTDLREHPCSTCGQEMEPYYIDDKDYSEPDGWRCHNPECNNWWRLK